MLIIEGWKPGHYDGRPMERALRSGRVGRGGLRTFHARFAGVKGAAARPAIDYAIGAGEWRDREDLAGYAGDPDELAAAAEAIASTARGKNGPTAERAAVNLVVELPADATEWQAAHVAKAIVEFWGERSRQAVVAVHMEPQPHLHALIAARPTRRNEAGEIEVDRSAGTRLLADRDAVKAMRADLAELINDLCDPRVRFHPGRLIDTGITRRAKRRVSQRAWCRLQQRERDPEAVAAARARHDQARGLATALREARADARARRLERRGLVPASTHAAAMKVAGAAVGELQGRAAEMIKRVSAERDVARAVSAKARAYAADRLKATGLELPASFDSDAKVQSDVWAVVRKGDQAALERLRQMSAELVSLKQAEAARARPVPTPESQPAQMQRRRLPPRDFER